MLKTTIIGSSNIYRPYDILSKEDQDKIDLKRCTRISAFKVFMEGLIESQRNVIISVIENFVCDAVGEVVDKDEVGRIVKGVLDEFFEILGESSCRLPRTRFAMVEPTQRPGVGWYTMAFNEFKTEFTGRLTSLRTMNVSVIKYDDLPSQIFDQYGVHLTPGMGLQFLNAVSYFAEQVFKAPVVDLAENEETMEASNDAIAGGSGQNILTSLESDGTSAVTQSQLIEVVKNITLRRHNDNLVLARIREELDFAANVKKEDRLIISGLSSNIARPASEIDARRWIRDIAGKALDKILPNSSEKIQFCSANRSKATDFPVCEVKFKETDWAGKVRREFGKQRKEGRAEGRIFVANCVTQATRVRLEILRAIAKKNWSANEDMLVMGFTSRPILQIRRKDGSGQRTLTFVDAVALYGNKVKTVDLALAYERAGRTYMGQMEQNFVVLNDEGVKEGGRQPRGGGASGIPVILTGGNATSGNKRGLDQEKVLISNAKRQTQADGKGKGSGKNVANPTVKKNE